MHGYGDDLFDFSEHPAECHVPREFHRLSAAGNGCRFFLPVKKIPDQSNLSDAWMRNGKPGSFAAALNGRRN